MNKKYLVNPILGIVSVVVSILFLLMVVVEYSLKRYGTVAISSILWSIFFCSAVRYCSVLLTDENGVQKSTFGFKSKVLPWTEITDVCVCGTRLFKSSKSDNVGSLYLVFSTEKMDDDKLFEMMLKWPPRDKYYMLYNECRLTNVQSYYYGKISTYNIGDNLIGK